MRSEFKRVRLSGALLFAVYDGIRVDVDFLKFFTEMGVGEIIRKADGLFQRSEIKGFIKVHYFEGRSRHDIHTIFERTDYDYIAFAEPFYFNVEFNINKTESSRRIEIECNLQEDEQGTICEGIKEYYRSVLQDSEFNLDLNATESDTDTDINPESVAKSLNALGYYKLLKPTPATNLAETIECVLALKDMYENFGLITLFFLKREMTKISGVFLVSLNLETVVEDTTREGYYRKVKDYWYLFDGTIGRLEDPYGQLYILPQASLLSIEGINFQLPKIQGPAFPLFDLTRAQRESNDYQEQAETNHEIEIYYKNEYPHSFIVFINMWEVDGNTELDVDDCFAKGNALGFDHVMLSNLVTLSACDYLSDDIGLSMGQYYDPVVDDASMQELSGTFEFKYTSDDPGDSYEPYGYFNVTADGTTRTVWNNYTQIKLGDSFSKQFGLYFPTMNSLIIDGYVMEADSSTPDDGIGRFSNVPIDLDEISSPKMYEFDGDDGYVHIILYHPQHKPVVLVEYELSGTFQFMGKDGNGMEIEPFGEFSIEIKKRTINAHFGVWKAGIDGLDSTVSIDNDKFYKQPFLIRFRDIAGFHTWDSENIVLHGGITDLDDISNDNTANYEGHSIAPTDLYNTEKGFEFVGEDGKAIITMELHLVDDDEEDNMMVMEEPKQHSHSEL